MFRCVLIGILFLGKNSKSVDVLPQTENYLPDYTYYHNLTSIQSTIKAYAVNFNNFIKIDWSYTSRNSLPQLVAHMTNISKNLAVSLSSPKRSTVHGKVRILLSYGEHARELFPIESLLYLMKNLTSGLLAKPGSFEERFSQDIFSNFDIYVIVIANPDGRKYLESSHNFCWRGTSTGVDINRNFDWQFAKEGSSSNPEDDEYRGPQPFSEPECRVYLELTQTMQFDAFVSFHSGIRHIYMPFSDTASKTLKRKPYNSPHMAELMSRLAVVTKYKFKYGTLYDLNFYTADGTAIDYMSGVRQIPFSLAIEMWGNESHKGRSCFDEFNPQSKHLQAEVEALHPFYVELFSYLAAWKIRNHLVPDLSLTSTVPRESQLYLVLAVATTFLIWASYRHRHIFCAPKPRVISLRKLSSILNIRQYGHFR